MRESCVQYFVNPLCLHLSDFMHQPPFAFVGHFQCGRQYSCRKIRRRVIPNCGYSVQFKAGRARSVFMARAFLFRPVCRLKVPWSTAERHSHIQATKLDRCSSGFAGAYSSSVKEKPGYYWCRNLTIEVLLESSKKISRIRVQSSLQSAEQHVANERRASLLKPLSHESRRLNHASQRIEMGQIRISSNADSHEINKADDKIFINSGHREDDHKASSKDHEILVCGQNSSSPKDDQHSSLRLGMELESLKAKICSSYHIDELLDPFQVKEMTDTPMSLPGRVKTVRDQVDGVGSHCQEVRSSLGAQMSETQSVQLCESGSIELQNKSQSDGKSMEDSFSTVQRSSEGAHSVKDVLAMLGSVYKVDLTAKLVPFHGRLSLQDMTIILKLLENKQLCFKFYTWMKQETSCTLSLPSFLTVIRILLSNKEWEKLAAVAEDLFISGFTLDNPMYCRIINTASLSGQIAICKWWFARMKVQKCWPDRVTYNTMIQAYAKAKLCKEAFATFEEMQQESISPDIHTFAHLLNSCNKSSDQVTAHTVFNHMHEFGVKPDIVAYCILLHTYGKQGKAIETASLFKEMQEAGIVPDGRAYNILISAFGKAGMMDQATAAFHEYQKLAGLNPDKLVFWTMLHLYAKAGTLIQALSVKKMMRVARLDVDESCYTSLISGFKQQEKWEDAIRAFKEMQRYRYPIRPETYEMMMKIYFKAGYHVECERIIDQMARKGIRERTLAYEIMINIYKRTNNLTNATRIYECMKRNGARPNRNIFNAVIYMNAKAGKLQACEKIFEEMRSLDVKFNKNTCLSQIQAYAVQKQYSNARDLYWVMKNAGIRPDFGTCEIMVEILVKSGHLQEAVTMVKELEGAGTSPSKRILDTILGAQLNSRPSVQF